MMAIFFKELGREISLYFHSYLEARSNSTRCSIFLVAKKS